jgi:hypothetical protein
MAKQTKTLQKKTLSAPDEVRTFDKGKVEVATVVLSRLVGGVSSRGGNGLSRLSR